MTNPLDEYINEVQENKRLVEENKKAVRGAAKGGKEEGCAAGEAAEREVKCRFKGRFSASQKM